VKQRLGWGLQRRFDECGGSPPIKREVSRNPEALLKKKKQIPKEIRDQRSARKKPAGNKKKQLKGNKGETRPKQERDNNHRKAGHGHGKGGGGNKGDLGIHV